MFNNGQTIGKYEILEPLGQGGLSQIYKARGPDGKLVTLKFPSPVLVGDPSTYERFKREFAIGQKLMHPAFPRARAFEDSPSGPFLVLEYVSGNSLRSCLVPDQALPLDQVLSIAIQLSEALDYIHKNGIYHRDLKPENIILDSSGKIHILDFGIALLEGARRVTWGSLSDAFGTADYMSPEQIQGKRGDARTDIYSLGIILYEMLTGRVPFSGDNPLAVMSQHMTSTPPAPRKINPHIPAGMEAIILKSIRRNADERYQTAEDLSNDLQHLDSLDLSQFQFGPERRSRTVLTDRQIWTLTAIIAAAFLAVAALIIVIIFLIKRG
jgi:serine/threonine protein kinase